MLIDLWVVNLPCVKQCFEDCLFQVLFYVYNIFIIYDLFYQSFYILDFTIVTRGILTDMKNNYIELNNLLKAKKNPEYYRMLKNSLQKISHCIKTKQ